MGRHRRKEKLKIAHVEFLGDRYLTDSWWGSRDRGPAPSGCLTYVITGNVGNCPMLPVWRAIGRLIGVI